MALTDKDRDEIAQIEDRREPFHSEVPPRWCWVTGYADACGPVIELCATWDDALKKDGNFCAFAVDVAQEILGHPWKVSREFGKWGAAIVAGENPGASRAMLEAAANKVIRHPSWLGLVLAARVFTYGTK